MKQLKYIIAITLGLFLHSCDNFLDVKQKGMSIPHTIEDYDLMLNKSYGNGSISNVVMMSPEAYLPDSYMGDISKVNLESYKWAEHPYLKDENDDNWNSFYSQIMVANEIINNVDNAESTTKNESLRLNVKGQAYAERAKCLFGLVNLYAKPYSPSTIESLGVPLPLENDIHSLHSRATIGEVYKQICSDIKNAEPYLPKSVIKSQRMRASQQSLAVLKSKVYLFMNEIDSAKAAIDKAFEIENPQLVNYESYVIPLDPSYEQIFINAGKGDLIDKVRYILNGQPFIFEEVDELLWSGATTSNFRAFCTVFYSDYILNMFGEKGQKVDYRFRFNASEVDPMTAAELPAKRYWNRVTRTFSASIPEMYLLRAECNARKGNIDEAVNDINTLRNSRKMSNEEYSVSAGSKEEAIEMVKKERVLELAFTGLNWFDLRRYQAYGEPVPTFTRTVNGKTYTLAPGSPRYTCAIPRYVISKNPNIIQNER